MHWSIDSLAEAKTAAGIKKLKALVGGMNIRGVTALLILIGLIIVSVQSAFLLREVERLNERTDQLNERLGPIQEKTLELYVEPEPMVPVSTYETKQERML
jgi:hypothetical protein